MEHLVQGVGDFVLRETASEAVHYLAPRFITMVRTQFEARWGHESPEIRERASNNVDAVLKHLRARLETLDGAGNRELAIRAAATSPQVSSFVRNSLAIAAETDEDAIHACLARLIAERLVSDDNSTRAATIRMALDVLPLVNSRQLKLLGLLCLLGQFPPATMLTRTGHLLPDRLKGFMDWLENVHEPVSTDEISWIDVYHLETARLVTVSDSIDRGTPPLILNAASHHQFVAFEYHIFNRVYDYARKMDMSRVKPTTVGSVIGAIVLDDLSGVFADLTWLDSVESTEVTDNLVRS